MTVEFKASAGKDEHKASVKDTAADSAGLNLLSAHDGAKEGGAIQPSLRLALSGASNHANDGGLAITPIPEFASQKSAAPGAGLEKTEKRLAQGPAQADRAGPVLAPAAKDAWTETGLGLPRDASPAEYWGRVVDHINSNARNPLDVTTKAIHDSRVVGFGETHDPKDNGFVKFGAENMAAFKAAGMTHLAVEVPSNLQGVLDNFQRTGVLNIPDHLMKDGKPDRSDVALGALNVFRNRIHEDPGYVNLLKAARANGVKLVAVDKPDVLAGFAHPEKMTQQDKIQAARRVLSPEVTAERNKYMAQAMEGILDGKLSPLLKGSAPAKVGFWAGNLHVGDSRGQAAITPAGEMLAQHLAANGEHYASLFGQAGSHRLGFPSTMFALTPFVQRPAAIATRDANGQPNVLGGVKESQYPSAFTNGNLSDFDYVLLFPRTTGQGTHN
jgi:hypothetical protein